MRRTGLAFTAVLVIAAATACGPGGSAPEPGDRSGSPTAAPDRIKQFDFGTAAWNHPFLNPELRPVRHGAGPTVRLRGGKGTGKTSDGAPVACHLVGSPVYGDIGDGTLAAAVALSCAAGNGDATSWYVWRWSAASHTAVQSDQPIAQDARCGDAVDSVRYAGHAFVVAARELDEHAAMSCADAGHARRKTTYAVALRHGFLERVRPAPAALRSCRNNSHPEDGSHGATLYATRSSGSDVVYRTTGRVRVLSVGGTDYYEDDADLTGRAVHWQFVRVEGTADNTVHCGYRMVPGA